MGQAARATAESASAFGQYAEASGAYSTALGQQATASANNSVALGYLSEADRDNSVSVGQSGAERQIVHVAAGTEDTDAVNVSQLKGVSQNFSSQINSVRQDSERGDALNAALSALQPASYDPYRPTQIMAGAGSIRDTAPWPWAYLTIPVKTRWSIWVFLPTATVSWPMQA